MNYDTDLRHVSEFVPKIGQGKDRCDKGLGESSLLRHKLHHFWVGMTK